MAQIKSTRTAIIDAEEQISGTILIELNSPNHDITSGTIRCNVNYHHYEESRYLSSKTWVLPPEKTLILLQACINNQEGVDQLLAGFLLEKFQEKSVYGILASEWIFADEILEQRPSE